MSAIPFLKEIVKNLLSIPLTDKKAIECKEGLEGYRGKIHFNEEVCIGCGLCTRVCASNAIEKKMFKVNDGQKITLIFDMSSCTFCGMCSDFCPKKAIKLTKDCILIASQKNELKTEGSFIKKIPSKPKVK